MLTFVVDECVSRQTLNLLKSLGFTGSPKLWLFSQSTLPDVNLWLILLYNSYTTTGCGYSRLNEGSNE